MAETKPDQAPPATGESKKGSSGSVFAFKALVTTVGGSLLTLGVAIAQVQYSDHLEVVRRQGDQGVAYQEHLLTLTGQIRNELSDIVNLARKAMVRDPAVREQFLAQAEGRMNDNLDPLYRQWGLEMLFLRNRGTQVFGADVGDFVDNLRDEGLQLNECTVVVPVGTRRSNGECGASAWREAVTLTASVISIRQQHSFAMFRAGATGPTGFDANAAFARTALHHYIACAQRIGDPRMPLRCRHLGEALAIAIQRAELVALARENLADAIRGGYAARN